MADQIGAGRVPPKGEIKRGGTDKDDTHVDKGRGEIVY